MFSVISFKIELNIFLVILYFCRDYAVKKFEDYSKNKSPKSGGQSAIEIILNVCHIAHHTEEEITVPRIPKRGKIPVRFTNRE